MQEILERENIDGFPTFNLYKEGHFISEYLGNRTEIDLLEYLQRKLFNNEIQVIDSIVALAPYLSALDRTENFEHGVFSLVLGLFPIHTTMNEVENNQHQMIQPQGLKSEEAHIFYRIANKFDFAMFFVSENPKVIAEYPIEVSILSVYGIDSTK
jgi:hypothetical protein